jgi:acetyl-CoA carboxylase biotin carboxyl carrier protein
MDAEQYIRSDLRQLLAVLQSSDVRELELQEGDFSIRLRRSAVTSASDGEPVDVVEMVNEPSVVAPLFVVSPLVGTFYRAGEPGAAPLVEEGSYVEDDTVVGIIESLGALTEVRAGVRGVVTQVLATDGHAVEYGQPLFDLSLNG